MRESRLKIHHGTIAMRLSQLLITPVNEKLCDPRYGAMFWSDRTLHQAEIGSALKSARGTAASGVTGTETENIKTTSITAQFLQRIDSFKII